ncbi:hypothetical protein CI610_03100 [invertebrate metagenome]|uniref:Uncharacterized protein n=1 Tax=invertebrate metagenome TaxID=1711999 RepID=A0A2H9T434_9ZZZZ
MGLNGHMNFDIFGWFDSFDFEFEVKVFTKACYSLNIRFLSVLVLQKTIKRFEHI